MNRTIPVSAPANPLPKAGWCGVVSGLHTAPRAMLPMRSVDHLTLIAGVGVVGDRYTTGRGNLSEIVAQYGLTDKRHISLFEQEVIEALRRDHGLSIEPASHRRNITTVGVPLNHLVGRRFRVGDAIVEGIISQPCKHLQDVIGLPVTQYLINRGGLFGKILTGAIVRIGDPIELV